jgi:hypothetical protein
MPFDVLSRSAIASHPLRRRPEALAALATRGRRPLGAPTGLRVPQQQPVARACFGRAGTLGDAVLRGLAASAARPSVPEDIW